MVTVYSIALNNREVRETRGICAINICWLYLECGFAMISLKEGSLWLLARLAG